ncbi:MAG: DUF5056 domain-containing protein [Prevotellaceae bacterium]|nr:DUF5056 domain-containing protein [Prevotellaceae bacterium]
MTERNEILIESFFAEHKQQLAPDEFSRRVMQRLPDRYGRIATAWSAFCIVLAIALFTMLDGWLLVWIALRDALIAIVEESLNQPVNLPVILLAVGVLAVIGWRKLSSLV